MKTDRTTLIAEFEGFYSGNLITDVINAVKSGKEATVYRCRAHPSTGEDFLAAKHYRSFQQRNFRNDAVYQQGRPEWSDRNGRALKRKSKWGRMLQFGNWVSNEFETLEMLYEAGVDVPKPFDQSDDVIIMEFIGDEEEAAEVLNRISPSPDEAEQLFQRLMRNVRLMLDANRIHADLSAFNILYWQGDLKIIDFPQSVHPRRNPQAFDLLLRDIENIYKYFLVI